MSEPVAFKYRAFISYSHADQDRAKWLHRAVDSFPIGKDLAGRFTERGEIPSALRPVFRDREEFTAGGGLSEQTLSFYGFRVARGLERGVAPLLLAPLRALM